MADATLLNEPYVLDSAPCAGLASANRTNELGYRWTAPASCTGGRWPFRPFAALARPLEKVLKCHPLLLVGDSLSNQFHLTLMRMANYTISNERSRRWLNESFVRNDLVLTNNVTIVNRERFDPWAPHLPTRQPHIIVLNRGAHFRATNETVAGYRDALDAIRRLAPDAMVFVRSTPGGHAECWNRRNLAPLDPRFTPRPAAIYNWSNLRRQDLVMDALLASDHAYADYAFFMDVTVATGARPDSHKTDKKDCLHYCIPGPIDMWADLFANMVLYADKLGLLPSTCHPRANSQSK